MAAESIGTLVPTKIPGLSDQADIQAALRTYHYGSDDFDTAETDPAELINPSIAYTINDLQEQIDAVDLSNVLQSTDFSAKGDLLSASANDTLSVLAVGANGRVLTANSATDSGLEWTVPAVTLTNSVDLQNKTLTSPQINLGINQQTTRTYTIALTDNGKLVEINNDLSIVISVPTNSVAFPVGSQINILQTGLGQVSVAAVTSGTTTINATPGLNLRAQWSSATLIKRATEQWVLIGDLSA
jgi:hypothetical protein